MKQVSNAYKASMKNLMRNRSFVKVSFANVNTSAPTDGSWVSNGQLSYSSFDTLDYEYSYGNTYGALELNRWALDGGTDILPVSPGNDGFVSSHMSDENGNFSTNAILTREFSMPYAFPGLTLTFDTRSGEWVRDVTVRFYLEGTEVDVKTVSGIVSTTVIVNTSAAEVDKVQVEFGETLPFRRPRLEYVLYGVMKEFTNDKIVSTIQQHDVDPLSRRLPNETFSFTVFDYEREYDPDNPSGIYSYIDVKSPVSIQFGHELADGKIEWIKADKYLLDSKPVIKNNQATFPSSGLLGTLTDTFYKSKLGQKNFYDMAEEVLTDAGLTPTELGTNPWVIDESLKDMYTTAALPIDTHAHCLQLIAHACRCRLFTDDDNVIHLKPFGVTAVGIYRGEWADNGHEWFSEWRTVDKGNTAENTYIALELNRWILGSPQVAVPDTKPSGRGFVGDKLSEASGEFSIEPLFSKTFDVSHDLPVLAIRFDPYLEEYPTAIRVQYYQGSTLLDTQTVTGIDSYEVFVNSNLAIDCTKIEVAALSGLPYRRFRVNKVYYRETDFTLDFNTISQDSQSITKIDQLKAVNVARYFYSEGDTTTLYQETTTETNLRVEFSGMAQNVQITVSGGTLISSNIYAQAADLVLSSGTKTVTITGKTLTESSVVVSKPVNPTGEVDTEENPLITNETMRAALADHVAAYLTMRNTYEAEYRGNPEMEVGDIIGLQTMFTDEIDGLVLVDEISFNGALSGKMKVKGLL